MLSFLSNFFVKGSLNRYQKIVAEINAEEARVQKLTDAELTAESKRLKEEIALKNASQEALNAVLPRAFALVRETSRRTLGQRHFDAQAVGGIVLHEGKIAEMATGEGKTLSATLPAYLNALTGKGVHIVTVNDYLARRDTVWMGQIYYALGISTSCLVHDGAYIYDPKYTQINADLKDNADQRDKERDTLGAFKVVQDFLRPISRKEAYLADITYGTNHEFGFDYLRDNLVGSLNDMVQREPHFAIIDEVDSILIDEARTPLIIAAPDRESSEFYKVFAKIVDRLNPEEDYDVNEKDRNVNITEEGINKVEKALGVPNIFDPEHSRLVHFLDESLKAKALFKRDKDYIAKNGEIIIVDEFTGRLLQGRRYSAGLHQAIEAKEGVIVKEENRTYAQITIQNYFRLYKKIAGMTGTAETSAEEFHKVYNLDVIKIPPNRPLVRADLPDRIYKNKEAKYRAVAREVKERHEKGQPVLLGTTSISNNEIISAYLTEAGVSHEVLNAKNNEREGAIVAQAGAIGAVTVATNMAGRGVDILLGGYPPSKLKVESEKLKVGNESEEYKKWQENQKKVKELGGLHVIGTERHDARRIDNQLRGRSGRQGDMGSTQFFLSLEDDLVRIFGGDRIGRLMESLNFPEDTPIESKMVSRAVNQAQTKVEGVNFDIRHHLLDFDDILNKQRTAMYRKRRHILEAGEKGEIQPVVSEVLNSFAQDVKNQIGNNLDEEAVKKVAEIENKLKEIPEQIEQGKSVVLSRHLVQILDMLWIEHLENLESLRESVGIRAYAQHEPIVEYRREAHKLFTDMHKNFESLAWNSIFPIFKMNISAQATTAGTLPAKPKPVDVKEPGRNDPCFCGSGQKYKKCHGK